MRIKTNLIETDHDGNELDFIEGEVTIDPTKENLKDVFSKARQKAKWSKKDIISCEIFAQCCKSDQLSEGFTLDDKEMLRVKKDTQYVFNVQKVQMKKDQDLSDGDLEEEELEEEAENDGQNIDGEDEASEEEEGEDEDEDEEEDEEIDNDNEDEDIEVDEDDEEVDEESDQEDDEYKDDDYQILSSSIDNQNNAANQEFSSLGQKFLLGELVDTVRQQSCRELIGKKPTLQYIDIQSYDKDPTYDFIENNNFEKKAKFLKAWNQIMCVLANLIVPSGYGRFLLDELKSERYVAQSLLYIKHMETHTLKEKLIGSIIEPNNILQTKATHYVSSIKYGIVIPITVKIPVSEEMSKDDANSQLRDFLGDVQRGMDGEKISNKSKFKCDIFVDHKDFSLRPIVRPISASQLVSTLKDLISRMETFNHNRGIKYMYRLSPISNLKKARPDLALPYRQFHPIPDEVFTEYKKRYLQSNKYMAQLYDMKQDLSTFGRYFDQESIEMLRESIVKYENESKSLQQDLGDVIRSYHKNGRCRDTTFQDIFEKYDAFIEQVSKTLKVGWTSLRAKVQHVFNWSKNKKFLYIGREDNFSVLVDGLPECYVWFSTWNETNSTKRGEMKLFEEYLKQGHYCIFVDQDVNDGNYPGESRLCHYKRGRLVDSDLLNRYSQKFLAGVARSNNKSYADMPKEGVQLELCCPKSYQESGCDDKKQFWYCEECNQIYVYYKECLYCKCGRATAHTFEFLCTDTLHGAEFYKFEKDKLCALLEQIPHKKNLNIVIVGPVGVGKSTWLNSFANYITYPTLEKAKKHNALKQLYLVPTAFSIDNEKARVIVGENTDNEELPESSAVGISATKYPRSIIFPTRYNRVQFIDTPGLCDTNGLFQDVKNINNIVRYLAHNVDEIHAICILLKPNDIYQPLYYCINELLMHLPKSAAKNVMFCYTYARDILYDKSPELLANRLNSFDEQIPIDFNKNTVYAMDNEPIRYVYAQKNRKIKFDEKQKEWFQTSWDFSQHEIVRFLDHVSQLEPCSTKDITSVNYIFKTLYPMTYVHLKIRSIIEKLNATKDGLQPPAELETTPVDKTPTLSLKVTKNEFSIEVVEILRKHPPIPLNHVIYQLEEYSSQYEKEKQEIKKAILQLGSMLKSHVILPYNNIPEYNSNKLDEQQKKEIQTWHEISSEINQFLDACDDVDDPLSQEEAKEILEETCSLKHTGDVIKKLHKNNMNRLTEDRFQLTPEDVYESENLDYEQFVEDLQTKSAIYSRYAPAPKQIEINSETKMMSEKADWSKHRMDEFLWTKDKELAKNLETNLVSTQQQLVDNISDNVSERTFDSQDLDNLSNYEGSYGTPERDVPEQIQPNLNRRGKNNGPLRPIGNRIPMAGREEFAKKAEANNVPPEANNVKPTLFNPKKPRKPLQKPSPKNKKV